MKLTKMDIYRKGQTTDLDGTSTVPTRLVMDALRIAEKYACRPCVRHVGGMCSICPVSRVTDDLVAALPAKREEVRR